MPPNLRRLDSDMTHVSDSEPEREARPKTLWKNCRILEDGQTIFILPRYLVRGAHMINCFGCNKSERTFYLDDVADFDWLLRAGN
ncbi:hypothetical protein C8R44DRAFT_783705 [Mycena epipterygia]|nr:hypothetical protein C8R44DRAFT_783705 [Mycena epipterygia]